MAEHDHAYRLLFAHARMVRDLLEGFLGGAWQAELDLSSLDRVNSHYVSEDLRVRQGDMVWRVRWWGRWPYVLLEFQSSVDAHMALRMLGYVALLYQELLREGALRAGEPLPPVLPIVLYNGRARWQAAQEVSALLASSPPGWEHTRVRLHYVLLDEGALAAGRLPARPNAVAALIRLEQARTAAEVSAVLSELSADLAGVEQRGLRRAFGAWIDRVILARLCAQQRPAPRDDLQETRAMLEERVAEWAEEIRQRSIREGLQQGRQQGLHEGRQQGEFLLLSKLLRRRFGELPAWVTPRLQQASPEQLERWAERLLETNDLETLFNGEDEGRDRTLGD